MSILSSTHTGKRGIDESLLYYGLDPSKATMRAGGAIDYDGDVKIYSHLIDRIPFNFNEVNGDFRIVGCYLTTLEGAPKVVNGDFDVSVNNLRSLEGCPVHANGVMCNYNSITSLAGSPSMVPGVFNCANNCLVDLHGAPKQVGGAFNCSFNSITSAVGGPERASDYLCHRNCLTSLSGVPRVADVFSCHFNVELSSFENGPERVDSYLCSCHSDHYEICKTLKTQVRCYVDISIEMHDDFTKSHIDIIRSSVKAATGANDVILCLCGR